MKQTSPRSCRQWAEAGIISSVTRGSISLTRSLYESKESMGLLPVTHDDFVSKIFSQILGSFLVPCLRSKKILCFSRQIIMLQIPRLQGLLERHHVFGSICRHTPGFLLIQTGNGNSNMFCKFQHHIMQIFFSKWRIYVFLKMKRLHQPPSPSDFDGLPYPWVRWYPHFVFMKMTAKDVKEIT